MGVWRVKLLKVMRKQRPTRGYKYKKVIRELRYITQRSKMREETKENYDCEEKRQGSKGRNLKRDSAV